MNRHLPYRLSTHEEQSGYAIVNGRPHGFKCAKRYEVTYKFNTREERQAFIDAVRGLTGDRG